MLEPSDAELGLETMGLLMGKLMKNTQNLTICPDGDDEFIKHLEYQFKHGLGNEQTKYSVSKRHFVDHMQIHTYTNSHC